MAANDAHRSALLTGPSPGCERTSDATAASCGPDDLVVVLGAAWATLESSSARNGSRAGGGQLLRIRTRNLRAGAQRRARRRTAHARGGEATDSPSGGVLASGARRFAGGARERQKLYHAMLFRAGESRALSERVAGR